MPWVGSERVQALKGIVQEGSPAVDEYAHHRHPRRKFASRRHQGVERGFISGGEGGKWLRGEAGQFRRGVSWGTVASREAANAQTHFPSALLENLANVRAISGVLLTQ